LAFKPDDFPTFTLPDDASIALNWGKKLQGYLHNIASAIGVKDISEIKIYHDTMYEIFTRVEKRRVYFHIYHNEMEMGEMNEGALLCFWILKLMPFHSADIPASVLNTRIAYVIFVNLLKYIASKTNKHVNVKKLLMDNLLYAFQYRDLSKEAIMALVESNLY